MHGNTDLNFGRLDRQNGVRSFYLWHIGGRGEYNVKIKRQPDRLGRTIVACHVSAPLRGGYAEGITPSILYQHALLLYSRPPSMIAAISSL